MNELFYIDMKDGISITYEQLLTDINSTKSFSRICSITNYYEIFKTIIISLLISEELVLVDYSLTKIEIENLVGKENLEGVREIYFHKVNNLKELFERISTSSYWKLTLFTSGTTGKPKEISHNYESLTRFVKINENQNKAVWGYAYNPTHIAGIQVFLQAFLNKNTIVRLFELSNYDIFRLLEVYKVTHISATPTFYRLLYVPDKLFMNVIRISSGGEKFDSGLMKKMKEMFPNAKVNNIFASTETGTLFASKDDIFEIKNDIKKYIKLVDGELFINEKMIGSSDRIELVNGWYPTGDLVEVISENPFTFKITSRKTEMINIGGYKVNPTEVEDTIRNIFGVMDVYVYSKKNSILGNVICADIVKDNCELDEKEIRTQLITKLQDYKTPRLIKFVKNIEVTRTGKIKRI